MLRQGTDELLKHVKWKKADTQGHIVSDPIRTKCPGLANPHRAQGRLWLLTSGNVGGKWQVTFGVMKCFWNWWWWLLHNSKTHFEMVWNMHFLIFFFNVYVSRLNSVIQNLIDNAHYKKTCWLKSCFFQLNLWKGQKPSRKNRQNIWAEHGKEIQIFPQTCEKILSLTHNE